MTRIGKILTKLTELVLVDTLGLGNISAGGSADLNSSLMYFGTGSTPSNLYNGTGVIQHEIDEILGGGGAGSMLGTYLQNYYVGALDLYRYSSTGAPSYTTSPFATSYFSIDGGKTFSPASTSRAWATTAISTARTSYRTMPPILARTPSLSQAALRARCFRRWATIFCPRRHRRPA